MKINRRTLLARKSLDCGKKVNKEQRFDESQGVYFLGGPTAEEG